MLTINNILVRILLSHLLIFLPLQILHCQAAISLKTLSNNLKIAQTLSFPNNVEILEDNYYQVNLQASEALKMEYGYTLGMLYQKESIEIQHADLTLLLKGKYFYEDVLSIDRNQLQSRKNLVLLLQSAKCTILL
jgi:hypothetical protein